jgi:hypothetical protein
MSRPQPSIGEGYRKTTRPRSTSSRRTARPIFLGWSPRCSLGQGQKIIYTFESLILRCSSPHQCALLGIQLGYDDGRFLVRQINDAYNVVRISLDFGYCIFFRVFLLILVTSSSDRHPVPISSPLLYVPPTNRGGTIPSTRPALTSARIVGGRRRLVLPSIAGQRGILSGALDRAQDEVNRQPQPSQARSFETIPRNGVLGLPILGYDDGQFLAR